MELVVVGAVRCDEKRLVDVIEEMAIAASIPPPQGPAWFAKNVQLWKLAGEELR